MRPTPNELVAGIVGILRDTVAPAVTDDHVRTQLAQVIAVLRGFDADDARLDVEQRDGELRQLLTECRGWIEADGERAGAFAAIVGTETGPGATITLAELDAGHEANRRALSTFIAELAHWRRTHGPASSDALLQGIGLHLAGPNRPSPGRP